MPELSIIFVGWFFSAISLVVLTVGGMMLMHLYKTGRLSGAYLQERGAQEIVLIAIWLVGLAAGAGVIYHHDWSQSEEGCARHIAPGIFQLAAGRADVRAAGGAVLRCHHLHAARR